MKRATGSIIQFRCQHCDKPNEFKRALVSADLVNHEREERYREHQRLRNGIRDITGERPSDDGDPIDQALGVLREMKEMLAHSRLTKDD